jgi:hypothetical protein
MDVRTCWGANGDSDHYLVEAIYRRRIMTWKKEHSHKELKINIQKLEIPAIRERYQQLTEEKLIEEETNNNDVHKTWENLKQGVTDAAITILGHAARPGRNWFDEECATALMPRNQAYKRRFVDKLCRKKKRVALNKRLCKISEEFKENDLGVAFKEVKSLKEGFKPSTLLCKDMQGNITGDSAGTKQRWKYYTEELLNWNSNEEQEMNELPELIEDSDSEEHPTVEEVRNSLRTLKNNKVPGADNIPAELLKYGGNKVIKSIHDLVILVWEKEQMSKDWRKSIIFLIHKKGYKLNCANYRGIALLCTVYKVFTNIIRRTLEPYVERIVGEYQDGFRAGRSITDQLFTVKQILEKCWEYDIKVYQLYVDFKQAYDSVHRGGNFTRSCTNSVFLINS